MCRQRAPWAELTQTSIVGDYDTTYKQRLSYQPSRHSHDSQLYGGRSPAQKIHVHLASEHSQPRQA
jgi:hypothetical protein